MLDFKSNEYYMTLALKQAAQAYHAGEVPIGAVIVHNDEIIGRAFNQVETLRDATAHAEILAITQASARIENWRLVDCTLFVTKEPCPMCAGAIVNSRMKKVVFGLNDLKGGGCGGAFNIHHHEGLLHNVEVESGLMEEESQALIQTFFKERRSEQKARKGNNDL